MEYNLDVTAEELKIFLDEAEEQIQRLNEGLLALEKNTDNKLLQDIFRAAHTIKGGAATLGRVRMTRLAHALETALNRLRNGELHPEPRLIDLMLQATDGLNELCHELAGQEIGDLELDPLRVMLENFVSSQPLVSETAPTPSTLIPLASHLLPLTSQEQVEAQTALNADMIFYQINATLAPDAFLPAARLLQLYFALLPLGHILKSSPTIEQIEQEEAGTTLTLIYTSGSSTAEIEAVLEGATDVKQWQLDRFDPAGLFKLPLVETVVPTEVNPLLSQSTESLALSSSSHDEIQEATQDVKATAAAAANSAEGKTIRVNVAQLDRIMNLIGELVVNRTSLTHIAKKLEDSGEKSNLVGELNETLNYLSRITDDLQENMLKTRMTPIENMFRRMPRLVRDLARQMGKEVDFILEGEQTELDRSIIEEISDPLIHLLRNAVDHGLESSVAREEAGKSRIGHIKLSALHQDGAVFIQVEDDGRGISPAKVRQKALDKGLITSEAAARLTPEEVLNLIFLPGFSTATTVTEVSGRGVGMDIVRTNVTRIGGTLELETVEGQGSRFIMRLPLTLAIIQALLVTVQGTHYAIPLGSVTETLRVSSSDIQTVEGVPLVRVRGKFLPLLTLEKALGFSPDPKSADLNTTLDYTIFNEEYDPFERQFLSGYDKLFPVVAVRFDRFQVGLVVDGFLGEQEVVIKPLGWYVGEIPGLAGAMIEGDGRIALIIDIPSLLRATLRGDQAQLRASLSSLVNNNL
ncbi:MAG: chemotaxis protein CheA [Chloroflexota bacterium]